MQDLTELETQILKEILNRKCGGHLFKDEFDPDRYDLFYIYGSGFYKNGKSLVTEVPGDIDYLNPTFDDKTFTLSYNKRIGNQIIGRKTIKYKEHLQCYLGEGYSTMWTLSDIFVAIKD